MRDLNPRPRPYKDPATNRAELISYKIGSHGTARTFDVVIWRWAQDLNLNLSYTEYSAWTISATVTCSYQLNYMGIKNQSHHHLLHELIHKWCLLCVGHLGMKHAIQPLLRLSFIFFPSSIARKSKGPIVFRSMDHCGQTTFNVLLVKSA